MAASEQLRFVFFGPSDPTLELFLGDALMTAQSLLEFGPWWWLSGLRGHFMINRSLVWLLLLKLRKPF